MTRARPNPAPPRPTPPAALLALLFAAPSPLVAGCPGGDDDDSAAVDEWPASFEGTVVAHATFDGVTECDATIELAGTRYTGECPGCDYAFAVDATLARDDGTDACVFDHRWSYLPDDTHVDLVLAHAPTFTTQGWYGTYAYDNALLTGYSVVGDGGALDGPHWWAVMHDSSADGVIERAGDRVDWTVELVGPVDRDPYRDDCAVVTASDADEPFGGAHEGLGTMACGGEVVDVWTFHVAEAGATVTVTVDTVGTDTTFDPRFYVNGPDGCTFLTADDSFECTYPPPAYRCPSATFSADAGTHLVVVESAYQCAGDQAGYVLRVGAADGAALALHDGGVRVTGEYALSVTGSGALIP